MSNLKRYFALDGLRGILAIAVVFHHYAQLYHVDWMGKAWISVDAFFILSGFVITHSYTSRVQAGMRLIDFAKSRLLRLYPMYAAGLVLGIAGIWIELSRSTITLPELSLSIVYGIFIFPYWNQLEWPAGGIMNPGAIFPLNVPAWSLFFELFVNVLFFWWITLIKSRAGLVIFSISLLVYFFSVQFFGIHSGWVAINFAGGFSRVILYFSLGCAIYSIHGKLRVQSPYSAIILTAILLLGFAFRNSALSYFLLLAISPLAILIASRVVIPDDHKVAGFLTWLGGISYPIYITHYPLARFSYWIFQKVDMGPKASVLLGTLFALAVAIPLVKLEPVIRRRLASMLKPAGVGRAA